MPKLDLEPAKSITDIYNTISSYENYITRYSNTKKYENAKEKQDYFVSLLCEAKLELRVAYMITDLFRQERNVIHDKIWEDGTYRSAYDDDRDF
jgi:hypothetical protein